MGFVSNESFRITHQVQCCFENEIYSSSNYHWFAELWLWPGGMIKNQQIRMSFMLATHLLIYFIMKFLRKCVLTNNTLSYNLIHAISCFIASRGDYVICFAYLAAQFRQLFACNIPHNHSEPHKCSFQTVP